MNIKINLKDWVFLIVIICLLSGCNIVLGLKHYVPPEGSNLRIEFDYPKKWEWVDQPQASRIYVFEPDRQLYYPGQKDSPSLAGVIAINIDSGASPESQEELIHEWQDSAKAIGEEILEDKTIVIDGVPARWISSRVPERLNLNQDFELYSVVVFVYENHNLYDLILEIPMERQEGEFVRDFNRMISTIEFVH
jgi:hypothetical protein